MKAVVFRGPFDVGVETRAKPTIRDQTDAIIKVKVAGICGRYCAQVSSIKASLWLSGGIAHNL